LNEILGVIDVVPIYRRVFGPARGYFFDSTFQFTTTVTAGEISIL
jgi:hypothetical protein